MPCADCKETAIQGKSAGRRTSSQRSHASTIHSALIRAAQELRTKIDKVRFAPPVTHVYNPLAYAWKPHVAYLTRYGNSAKRVVFLGMNPGPFGMVQTGVPFGEVIAVSQWLGIKALISKPPSEHPRRPISGFACSRSEVSGRRLWNLFADRFGTAQDFFAEHIVMNYCPLAFLESTGRNRTPDKLPPAERAILFDLCDQHLREIISALEPDWIIGIGDFASKRARAVFQNGSPRIGQILHPSPASPAANRDWAARATEQLAKMGVWRAPGD